EGWAIDDFKIYFPSLQTDAGIAGFVSPLDSVEIGTAQNITVNIKNFGTDTIFSTDVKYTIGTTVVTETFNGIIPSDSIVEFTFSQTYIVNASTDNICVTTLLAGDMQSVNDVMCKTLVTTQAAHDAGISSIYAPYGETTIGSAIVVKVYITNYGSEPITTCDVQYTVSGVNVITETFTGNIASGDSTEYIFNTPYSSPTGSYSVCARTQLTNDADLDNDSKCVQVIGTSIENATGDKFIVTQNQPNPAINNTTVNYYIPKAGTVSISLVNVLGKTIYNEEYMTSQGNHQWNVNTLKLESGIYYYTLTFDSHSYTYKMIIVK
ncbi:MAG: T9SS type A sorting domain-containing protein, partial [Chlamydiia bacterium]|nr:T9SS type A sorting domain-containing protein [Chlamydiia bacterium]